MEVYELGHGGSGNKSYVVVILTGNRCEPE
jgi:hypothetical protein